MSDYRYLLIPRNDLLESFNNIFTDIIKNVYCSVIYFPGATYRLEADIKRTYSEISFYNNEFELENNITIVLEFISGKLVFFHACGTGGATLGEFKDEYEIYYSSDLL